MAFGMFSPDPNDSFKTGEVLGAGAQARAQDFLNNYIETDIVGGAAVNTIGQTRAKELLDDAQQSAKSTTNTASAISGGLDFLGGMGSFGAAGGFGNFGGGTTSTSGIGSGVGQASLTPGVDTRSTFSNRINPIAGFGGVMNA
jgi:hypothetical protein